MEAAVSYYWHTSLASFFQNNGFIVQIFGRASTCESGASFAAVVLSVGLVQN